MNEQSIAHFAETDVLLQAAELSPILANKMAATDGIWSL